MEIHSKHFKELLLKEKESVKKMIDNINKDYFTESSQELSGELSNYDNHPGDIGSELFEKEHILGIKTSYVNNMNEIDDALEKIESNKYGICKYCNNEIDEERLKIIPSAELCIKCTREREQINKDIGDSRMNRPIEEESKPSIFGRGKLNQETNKENEGIGVLEELMNYGSAQSPQEVGNYKSFKEIENKRRDKSDLVDNMDAMSNKSLNI